MKSIIPLWVYENATKHIPFEGRWEKRVDERVYDAKRVFERVDKANKRFWWVYYSTGIFYSVESFRYQSKTITD